MVSLIKRVSGAIRQSRLQSKELLRIKGFLYNDKAVKSLGGHNDLKHLFT